MLSSTMHDVSRALTVVIGHLDHAQKAEAAAALERTAEEQTSESSAEFFRNIAASIQLSMRE